jgi:hypothetical protein
MLERLHSGHCLGQKEGLIYLDPLGLTLSFEIRIDCPWRNKEFRKKKIRAKELRSVNELPLFRDNPPFHALS